MMIPGKLKYPERIPIHAANNITADLKSEPRCHTSSRLLFCHHKTTVQAFVHAHTKSDRYSCSKQKSPYCSCLYSPRQEVLLLQKQYCIQYIRKSNQIKSHCLYLSIFSSSPLSDSPFLLPLMQVKNLCQLHTNLYFIKRMIII